MIVMSLLSCVMDDGTLYSTLFRLIVWRECLFMFHCSCWRVVSMSVMTIVFHYDGDTWILPCAASKLESR